jgi:hypothetical protein
MACIILPPMRRRLLFGSAIFLCLTAPLRSQNFVCSLSDKQEQDAPKAFEKLAPIFTQPRCFNCHGGVSPFNNGRGTHPEFGFKIVPDKDGNEDVKKTFADCHTSGCHDSFPAFGAALQTWRLAPTPSMQFKRATNNHAEEHARTLQTNEDQSPGAGSGGLHRTHGK